MYIRIHLVNNASLRETTIVFSLRVEIRHSSSARYQRVQRHSRLSTVVSRRRERRSLSARVTVHHDDGGRPLRHAPCRAPASH